MTIISRKAKELNKSGSALSWVIKTINILMYIYNFKLFIICILLKQDEVKKNGIPSDTVAVINAAGEPILEPTQFWTNKFKKTVWDSRVCTNEILVNAINQMNSPKPKLFISFSGVGMFV